MSKKGRNGLEQSYKTKIYNNDEKEVTAEMVRAVFEDYKDSLFNLVDDRLKNMLYEGDNQTLEQKLAQTANIPPLWGSTGYFDVGGSGGSVTGNQGIVTSVNAVKISNKDTYIDVTFSQDIANKKIVPSLWTNNSSAQTMNDNNDICMPVMYRLSGNRIRVGLREVSQPRQSIRIEFFAFTVQTS